ncbi:metallophosphoesterase [Roseisolibacter sp. H3M3-2]|uniref:metallophosphoesterase n=1 Tax=Roseisolibacter sp. H3M3-2 TaxID=3031323 RepID=UPI0023DA204E|nr:metallophosphoesterase [Roseisolibacter sp. H3M3-2]MDF1501511.1 metallophosphoesterase [Roseisolibacter sp. H3M3-2]
MRIGLLSDTHDRVPAVAELLRRFAANGVQLVMHAGDFCSPFSMRPLRETTIPLLGVFGRNDGDHDGLSAFAAALPAGGEIYDSPHSFEVGGHTVLLVHDLAEANPRSLESHQVIVHGCAHVAEMKERGGALLVNPGEACGWLHGAPTGAILDLVARRVEFLKLEEPEWRA